MGRVDLTDAQWRRLEPHLPSEKPWTGHPNAPHRRIIDGILWILRTGAPWRALPARHGPLGALGPAGDGVEPLLSLARLGRVGPDPGGVAGRGGGGRRDRLGPAPRGCDGHPRPSARRRRPP